VGTRDRKFLRGTSAAWGMKPWETSVSSLIRVLLRVAILAVMIFVVLDVVLCEKDKNKIWRSEKREERQC
jgi:hypothetical protein